MSAPQDSESNIPPSGILLLVMVCFLWGANIVTIKVSNQGIPPILAATLRSVLAAALLWAYGRSKGEKVFLRPADMIHGLIVGSLFGLDFLFLYWGPAYTEASRAVIFLYTQPLWTALGAHIFLSNDRLTWVKSIGLLLAFAGMASVFGSKSATLQEHYWVGDLMEVAAAIFWAATTIYIKRFVWGRSITHFQTLFAQLFFSIPVLALGWLVFEWGTPVVLTPPVLAAFAYQTIVVAFFSYLFWFWMIHQYQVSRLASFTFLAPLFGVVLSGVFLGEELGMLLCLGLGLVAAGIYLVNRP
ncbi:DMT family transporter [Thermodesulfobacteriota bacterium]